MSDNIELLVEANRRGLLKGEQKIFFDEAVKRGLINIEDKKNTTDKPHAEQDQPEDKGGLVKAFGAGVDKLQELGYRAVKGFTDVGNEGDGLIEQDGALSKFAQEGIDRNIEEQKAYEPTVKSYKDVDSVGSAASYTGELVANSFPYMVAAMTPVGAATMAGGLSQEAYEAQPEDEKNELRAVTSGVGQMALERLGIKGSLGDIGKEILKDGVIATAKRYGKGEFTEAMKDPATAVEFGKRVLKGSAWEGATEAMQESLAMWGAGKDFDEFDIINRDKNSDDILGADGQRLMESFVGGATAGGVIRTGSESAQKLISWQQKSAPIAKNGIDELVKQGVTQDEAVEQVRSQLIASAIKQGLTEVEAAAAAARTMKQEYDIDHEIFTPVANDVASRRKALYEKLERDRVEGGIGQVQESLQSERAPSPEELVQQQMQANDPEFFNQLNEQSEPVTQEVNNITETENNLPLAENNAIPEKDLQNEPQVIDPFAEDGPVEQVPIPEQPQLETETTASQEAVSISEPQENSDQAVGMKSLETETSPAIKQEEQSSSAQLKPEPSIDEAAHEAATSPTNNLKEPSDAQKEAGNYKKGRISVSGIDIAIENPEGSTRTGTNKNGEKWSSKIKHHYGDITGSKGADGDAIDVFVKPNIEQSDTVYIVDQVDPDSNVFDEHKVMMGFSSKEEAEQAYLANYDKDWKGLGNINEVTVDQFKSWVNGGNTTKPFDLTTPVNNPSQKLSKQTKEADKKEMPPVETEANNKKTDDGVALFSRDNTTFIKEGDAAKIKTGMPVSFNFSHNKESATKIFGIPKKGDAYGRGFEPSGRFVSIVGENYKPHTPEQFDTGTLSFSNPLVVDNDGLKWKETLSNKYKGKTGKNLSKAIINDGYDGIITTEDNRYISEIVDLTTFDESKARYSIAGLGMDANSSTTVSETEANQVVESIIKNWVGNDRANDFVVVSTFDDLPKSIKDAAKDQGAENDVRGVFHKGKTYLVRDKLKNQHEVEETIFHETYGHHGIRKLFGKEIAQKLNQLLVGIGGIKGLDSIAKKYNVNLEPYKKGLANSSLTNEQAQTILMDELLAHLAQNNKPSVMRKVKEIVGAIRQWLKKSGFVNLSGISDSELFYVLKQAREAVKSNSDNNLNDDIRFSISTDSKRQSSAPERLSIQEETTVDFALRKAQDKFRRLKVIQRELSINEDNDTYKAEEAIHGKVKNDIENIETKYVDKIAKLMAKNKLSQNEVDLYLIAKHAKERNAYIDTINPDLNGAGSGMSNEAAQAILDKAIVEEKRVQLEEVADHVYSMLEQARNKMVEFGLEPQDAIDAWQKQYKYYVPLKGYAKDEATQAIGSDGKKSKQYKRSGGFNVKGRETIKAMGRRSLAESPLLHAVSDTTRAIIRARTNEVGNTFLKMVEENPDPNLWEVFSDENPDHRRGEIKKDGETVIGQIPVTAYDMKKDKETYFATKVKGVEKFVKIHDPLLMRAMGNLGVEPMGYLTQAFGNATRFLSALNTTWNITFAPSNFVRDIQSAIANIVSENQALDGKIKDVDGFAFDMVKFIPQSLAVVRQGTVNKDFSGNGKFNTPELSAYFKEFLESGAKTGWVNQENIDQLGKNLGRAISRESNTKWGATQRGFKHIADFVENYNDIIENGTRFSAYYNARKRGVSVKRASSLAKNLTVNFNRKGEIGNGLNAFYMFSNANIQGNANLFRALFSRKNKEANVMDVRSWTLTQQLAVSAIGATVGMSYLMSAIGGDDEDGIPYYDKIPNYIKNTNFIFMTGGVNEKNEPNYISIPMPYGYNILASIGHAIYDSTNTNKSKASIASNLVSSVLSAFSPIGMEESESTLTGLTRTLTPTLAKPFVEITANENFFGGKIVYGQDGYATKKANANLGTDRTWEWTKNLTTWLNDITGGGTYRSGAVDITPQHIEHVLKFVGGGALQTGLRVLDMGDKAAQGKEIARKDIPLLRRFYKSVDRKAAVGNFYDTYNELKKYKEDYDLLKGKDRAEFRSEFDAHLRLYQYGSNINKRIRTLNKTKKRVEASNLTDSEKESRLKIIEDKKIELSLMLSKKRQELGIKGI